MSSKTLEDFDVSFSEEVAILDDLLLESKEKKVEERSWNIPPFKFEFTANLSKAYILSGTYDGNRKRAILKLYDPILQKIHFWMDNTGHLPYCISHLPIRELKDIKELISHYGFDHFEQVEKYDTLKDSDIEMTKIVAKDPLSIGGRSGSIRDIIPKAWEARIKYYDCFIYDQQLLLGMPYKIVAGKFESVDRSAYQEASLKIRKLFEGDALEFNEYVDHWINLFQSPLPSIKRIAMDIEVYSSVATRVPDPKEASEPIIAVSMVDSDNKKRVLLLRRKGVKEGDVDLSNNVNVEYCETEEQIIEEIFKALCEYPIVLTFNGDGFDVQYIHNRALNLGVPKAKLPIIMGNRFASLKSGIHIDLYKFFFNRSIRIYAFSQKYTELSLDSVAKALLGKGKVDLKTSISDLTYTELAKYCLRDSELVSQLSSFDNELVMKLILIMMRITKTTMEDLTRQGVSSWIRNLLYFEHRRLNYLIPRSEDILESKGKAKSEAVIKGKKFKGAIVVEPKPGVHFDVAVLDFASLYPSIIKNYNLSYETVLCSHKTCELNVIPDLPHWICLERKGLSSLIIGSLRDMRVKWYKKMARDKTLPKSVQNLYNVIQLTLKVLLNASYGVMGSESFNLYCPPLAEAVTAIGRYAISKTVEMAKNVGIGVIYGDTDSVFLKAPTPQQINELLKWSENELGMELEIDKVYRYAAFSHLKKNYLGVYADGKVDIKGLTGKKRHIPDFLKRAFMEMIMALSEVEAPKDFEQAKNRIREIVRTCYNNLKQQKYDMTMTKAMRCAFAAASGATHPPSLVPFRPINLPSTSGLS
ncbi:MAG: DNA-directed DNA polymerase I, partial [Candidatus Ranarchaeia archaeon]